MKISDYLNSSIGRKQIVAATGLALVLFLVGHLAGNLFFYGGPEAFNAYAKKLADLRPGLLVVEFGLLLIFVIHIYFTTKLVMENRRARMMDYAGGAPKKRSFATKLMPYTGTILLAFVIKHLMDFTFAKHYGPTTIAKGEELGLYGLVYNTFLNPMESAFYIVAMGCVGFHLAHGIQSVLQSFGYSTCSKFKGLAASVGLLIALGFSSIPIYVWIQCGCKG